MTRVEDLQHCFQGVVPAWIATCSAAGEPNITYLSQIQYVDPRHVALSCQFFNKTRRNLDENPHAAIEFYDPINLDAYRMRLRFLRAETSGKLFDTMSARIQVIASHTGMAGVFRLLSADVYEVEALDRIDGFLMPRGEVSPATAPQLPGPQLPGPTTGPLTELRGLQLVSSRMASATDLESLLTAALTALDEVFGLQHSMVLVHEDACGKLVTIASRGYGKGGIGAEVPLGAGVIGTAAASRRMVKVAGVGRELNYGRAIRGRLAAAGEHEKLLPEIPLPGLPDAEAQLALPLLAGDRLVGVLAVESRNALQFDEWDEAFLQIVANQIAAGIDRMQQDDDGEGNASTAAPPAPSRAPARRARNFVLYRNDDCVFVDGEYLIRNVPALILWKLLCAHRDSGRTEFSNRELRLDPSLGLPALKDNLESRLILLRRRLQEKCPEVQLVPVRRGRFALQLAADLQLLERDSS
jgi:predicted pyridoxine 5'-phosphate oxidase superfamily flavin-nucleotide-binding protein